MKYHSSSEFRNRTTQPHDPTVEKQPKYRNSMRSNEDLHLYTLFQEVINLVMRENGQSINFYKFRTTLNLIYIILYKKRFLTQRKFTKDTYDRSFGRIIDTLF